MTPFLTSAVRYDNVGGGMQNIPFPPELTTELRCRKAEQRAKETAMLTCCPCKFIGYVGQDLGAHVVKETELIFEWISVTKKFGESHIVRASYNNLFHHGQNVSQCPNRMRGRPGLVYSLQWV